MVIFCRMEKINRNTRCNIESNPLETLNSLSRIELGTFRSVESFLITKRTGITSEYVISFKSICENQNCITGIELYLQKIGDLINLTFRWIYMYP